MSLDTVSCACDERLRGHAEEDVSERSEAQKRSVSEHTPSKVASEGFFLLNLYCMSEKRTQVVL